MTRKDVKFEWNDDYERSFQQLKYCLTHAPILALPDDSGNFEIYSDASLHGLGCVLIRHGRVIAYASRRLKPHEMNYLCLGNLEALFVQENVSDLHRHREILISGSEDGLSCSMIMIARLSIILVVQTL